MEKRNPEPPGLAVLDGVGDGLLGDFIELKDYLLRERRHGVSHLKAAGERKVLSHSGYEFLEHGPDVSPAGIERAKAMSQVMRVIDYLGKKLLDLASVGGIWGSFIREIGFERL